VLVEVSGGKENGAAEMAAPLALSDGAGYFAL
jgi:hypothetical protein